MCQFAVGKDTLSVGTYALLCLLDEEQVITIGRLGRGRFAPGYYLYIGSALGSGGLEARIARHLRPKKKLFWHIDYFLQWARLLEVWQAETTARTECDWAKIALALPGSQVPMRRFGASDCQCTTHLIGWVEAPDVAAFAAAVPGLTRRPALAGDARDARAASDHASECRTKRGSSAG
jgi:Uri superfamily endonuclease